MITVTLPDGRRVDVQTDDPQNAAKVAHGWSSSNPKVEKTVRNTLGGLAGNYLDAMIPGAAGAVRGAREIVKNAVQAPFSDAVDFHPLKSYREGQAFQEARQKAANAAHPTVANIITGAGIVGGLALPATKVTKGATMAQKAKAGMKTAASYGALSGAMSSKQEGLYGKAQDALSSGVLSGLMGAGLPVAGRMARSAMAPLRPVAQPAARLLGRGLEGLGDIIPGSVGALVAREGQQLARDPARAAANAEIGATIRNTPRPSGEGTMNPMQVAQEVQRRQELGVPAVAADLDPQLRGRLQGTARRPGPATSRVREMIAERQAKAVERAEDHIQAALGPTANVEAQARALTVQGREAAAPLYEVSDAQAVPFTAELQELFQRPSARDAVAAAGRQLLDKGQSPKAMGLIEGPDGTFQMGNAPTMPLFDHVKTSLDRTVFGGQNPFATPEVTRASEGARTIRKRLLEIMDGAGDTPGLNPHWKPARDAYAGPVQDRAALELGEKMATSKADEIGSRLANMSQSAADHFRLGHRSGLVKNLHAIADSGDTARRLQGSLAKREAIAAAHGEDAAQALSDRLGPEQDALETWKALRGASVAPKAIDLGAIADAAQGVLQVATGRPVGGLWNIAKAAAGNRTNAGVVNDHVATVLAEPDAQALRKAMRDVQREEARHALVSRNAGRAYQRGSRFLGSVLGTNMIEPLDDSE